MTANHAGTQTFGPYTVVRTIRLDNPAFPQFTVMRGARLIGKSLSALDLGWCEFIERLASGGGYGEARARKADRRGRTAQVAKP